MIKLDIGDEIYFKKTNTTLKIVSYDSGYYGFENLDGSDVVGNSKTGLYASWIIDQVVKSEEVSVKKHNSKNQVFIE